MKIVVTGTRGIPNILGGVETHCEELFPRLVSLGLDVELIRRKSYVTDELKEYRGVKLHDITTPHSKSLEAIIHTFKAINYTRFRTKAKIIHIHAIGPAILIPYARILGLKVVFTHHGPDYDREKWGSLAKFILRLGEALGVIFSNEIIVISNVINDMIQRKYHRSGHLIYNGVPEACIVTDKNYLQSLELIPGKYLFAMGRFVPEKQFHILIEAFTQINQKDIKLVLAGDNTIEDDYSIKLKKMAQEKGVVLTGFIKGKPLQTLLSNAIGFILPSTHEGLPISLLEAMSYKLPVIVSDIPANKEVGLPLETYFKVGDISQLKTKIEKLIEEPISKINYDMEKYNWNSIAEQVAKLYHSLD